MPEVQVLSILWGLTLLHIHIEFNSTPTYNRSEAIVTVRIVTSLDTTSTPTDGETMISMCNQPNKHCNPTIDNTTYIDY